MLITKGNTWQAGLGDKKSNIAGGAASTCPDASIGINPILHCYSPNQELSWYNIFVVMNISSPKNTEENISRYFSIIGQPVRIQILMVIAGQEACVCHLETVLGMRQASISQHLMVLRKAGLVTTHRDGRNIYYKLQQPGVIGILEDAARLLGSSPKDLQSLSTRPIPNCPCPQCNPGMDPKLTCQNASATKSS